MALGLGRETNAVIVNQPSIASSITRKFQSPPLFPRHLPHHIYICVCVSKIVSCRSPAAALAVLWTMMYGRVISTNLPPPQFAHTRTHGHTDTRTHGHINLGHRLTAIKPSETFLKPLVCVLILLASSLQTLSTHMHRTKQNAMINYGKLILTERTTGTILPPTYACDLGARLAT